MRIGLQDSKCPTCTIDAVEVSAGGNLLMDAVEYGVLRRALDSGERSKALGNELRTALSAGAKLFEVGVGGVGAVWSSDSACFFKLPGRPSGLAALVRACLAVKKAVLAPQLHLRQLCGFAAGSQSLRHMERLRLRATLWRCRLCWPPRRCLMLFCIFLLSLAAPQPRSHVPCNGGTAAGRTSTAQAL